MIKTPKLDFISLTLHYRAPPTLGSLNYGMAYVKDNRPVIIGGQQIGAGWTPALTVTKALTILNEARRINGRAIFWCADEDHDREEVSKTVAIKNGQVQRYQFQFDSSLQQATGWLPWTEIHQAEAVKLWTHVPTPEEPTLRSFFIAVGAPLWKLGIEAYAPTLDPNRLEFQEALIRWRALGLEKDLIEQFNKLQSTDPGFPLNPNLQSAWFALNRSTGERRRLEASDPLPANSYLSPGAALRPLYQSLIFNIDGVVLGPTERLYWKIIDPLWEKLNIKKPRIIERPTVFVTPKGARVSIHDLPIIKSGLWDSATFDAPIPSSSVSLAVSSSWSRELTQALEQEVQKFKDRIKKYDRKMRRDFLTEAWGIDPEAIRQHLFPLDKDQERVIPGLYWLNQSYLLDKILKFTETGASLGIIEEL